MITGERNGYYTFFRRASSGLLTNAGRILAHGVQITTSMNAWPYVCDWNGDGKKDLLCGQEGLSSSCNVFVYLNQGTNAAPVFNDSTPVLNAGSPFTQWRTIPLYLDLDGDAIKDLILGEWYSSVRLYHNYGTNTTPSFNGFTYLVLPDSSGYSNGNPPRVAFSDWDGDGDLDMVTCDYYGGVFLRRNVTPSGTYESSGPEMIDAALTVTPNPSSGPFQIQVRSDRTVNVQVDIYSAAGALIASPFRGEVKTNGVSFHWDPGRLPDGVYFIQTTSGLKTQTRKITVVR